MKRKSKEKLQTIFHLYLSQCLSILFFLFARILEKINKNKSMDYLLKSIRFNGGNNKAIHFLKKLLMDADLQSLVSSPNKNSEGTAAGRSIALSEPILEGNKVKKKGVLLITFTPSFCSFLKSEHFKVIDQQYLFVLEPSWTGYADADILYFCQLASDLVIQATDLDDRALINTLFPDVKTIDIGASNWVNSEKFNEDKSCTPDIDILYVANNNPVKRVFRLIEITKVLREKMPSLKTTIICAGVGGESNEVAEEIHKNKLSETIELRDGVPHKELINLYNRAKVSVLFSLKEGSNRVLFESMFCNTPVFCVAENRGVNKSYINEFTGVIAYDGTCEHALLELVKNFSKFTPRTWALDNISPEVSTARLSGLIKNHFGYKINYELKTKTNDPEIRLLKGERKKANTIADFISNDGSK